MWRGGVGGRGQACTDGTHRVLFCSSSTASLICVHMYAMFTPAGISAANKRDHEVTVLNFVVTFDSLPKEHVK